jgi:hypothetical protein
MSGNGQYITGGVSSGYLYTSITPYVNLSISNNSIFGGDVSMNSRLYVGGDVSLNGRIFMQTGSNIYVGGVLFTGSSGGSGGGITSDLSTNARLFVNGDVSMNSRLYIGSDASINGNLYVSKLLKPTGISENFITNTGTTSPYTFDYSTGSTFYVTTPPATNFTCNFTNVPSELNRTYVATIIINTITNNTNRYFCNSVRVNSATATTPFFANGIPTAPLTSSNYITQSISIQRITTGDTYPNYVALSAVTAWY